MTRCAVDVGVPVISVAANLVWLVPGGVGGSEEYTTRLLAAVVRSAPADISLEIVASKRLLKSYPWLGEMPFTAVAGPLDRRGYRILAESTQVRRATRHVDIVHHFGGRLPALRQPCSLLTIHDMQPLDLPANFSLTKRRYLKWALQRSAMAASLICVPSSWVANSIVERLAVDPAKIRVVPSTWDGFANGDAPELVAPNDALIAGLADDPVVLYPAASHPHKNHLTLLEAVDLLADRESPPTLVLTGGAGRAETLVASRVAQARVKVLRLGRVDRSLLSALIRRADVLAFPSHYEGFGLPLLEAMAAGTPVIAADNTAMPEVVSDTGLLLGADDVEDWASAIAEITSNQDLADRMCAAGRARAECFAPEIVAKRLINVWREAAESGDTDRARGR